MNTLMHVIAIHLHRDGYRQILVGKLSMNMYNNTYR